MSNTFDVTNPDKPWIPKDPNAVLDYGWDLSNWLPTGDFPVSAVFTVGGGMNLDSQVINGHIVWAWLSGGSAENLGKKVPVTCHWITNEGREDDRTLYFKLMER